MRKIIVLKATCRSALAKSGWDASNPDHWEGLLGGCLYSSHYHHSRDTRRSSIIHLHNNNVFISFVVVVVVIVVVRGGGVSFLLGQVKIWTDTRIKPRWYLGRLLQFLLWNWQCWYIVTSFFVFFSIVVTVCLFVHKRTSYHSLSLFFVSGTECPLKNSTPLIHIINSTAPQRKWFV